jgi:hypothetical protein
LARIVILIGTPDHFETYNYYLFHLAGLWREAGHTVTVQAGPGPRVDADLAISHIDITQVDPAYTRWLEAYPVALNRAVTDISKRRISRQLVLPGDPYDGPVMVKSNGNAGGAREWSLAAQNRPWMRHLRLHKIDGFAPWRWRRGLPGNRYQVFPSPRAVPKGVWANPHLVVERLLCERRGDLYGLRTWSFFGDQEANSLGYAASPLVKGDRVLERAEAGPVPEDLRRLRRELGFDFGRFDYAIVDGRAVLFDANSAPTLGRLAWADVAPKLKHLADGLRAFL